MAGWSMLKNGSDVDFGDISNRIKGGGGGDSCCLDSNHSVRDDSGGVNDTDGVDYEDKLIGLFDQVIKVFLNAAAYRGCSRPIPVLLADGQSLDLLKLFWVVRERGGFDMVSGFWSFVAKELGLSARFAAPVKLVYFKYLYELERWLMRGRRVGRLGNGKYPSGGSLGFLSPEVETQFRSLLSLGYAQREKDGRLASFECKENGRSVMSLSDNIAELRVCNGIEHRSTNDGISFLDNDEKCYNYDADGIMILDSRDSKKEFSSRKRKRESLSEMLNWVIQVARCPEDLSIGKIPPVSNWKDHGVEELWIQAIRAKNALLHRRHVGSKSVQLLQINQRMDPSMYEDPCHSTDQSAERLRCSERLPTVVKPNLCSCCTSCLTPQGQKIHQTKTKFESELKEHECAAGDLSGANTYLSPSGDENFRRYVAIGPRFQADVPEWTGMVHESDSKWLGTSVWPLKCGKQNVPAAVDCIGKGRPDICGCQHPGSVSCIHFHIAERRMKLKLELGPVFYHWRFDRMGEEVSLRWTTKEEKRFKDMVRFNPASLGMCFWDEAHKYFPRKSRDELVSYYFNVFVARRRSYQNRVTPKDIDSDDDDSDFGSVSDGYGIEAITIPGDNVLSCSVNMECTDFA
ncbi:hypothetical protein Tsubulata_021062 [Turnera subulata]|uniref:ARID domain-containing protein n=1 Tax=Turnera subulata TaxID=218843 RepID=A0A9Q0FMD1_9ROSI|nr:hypothetical protein Tsubulata_021062 [Turnera subulata]